MKTKIERATEIHRSKTPHQMALRIVELEDALELAEEAVRAKPHDELIKAIDRVINGTLLDCAGNRDEDGMISPWADASSISHWIKILSEAAGKAKGGAA